MINKILELYSRYGKSLLDKGIGDAALPISVVDQALDLFSESHWVILGGDVYKCEDNSMNNIYADWHCNLSDSSGSCNYAKEHLQKLNCENIYVSFTIKN